MKICRVCLYIIILISRSSSGGLFKSKTSLNIDSNQNWGFNHDAISKLSVIMHWGGGGWVWYHGCNGNCVFMIGSTPARALILHRITFNHLFNALCGDNRNYIKFQCFTNINDPVTLFVLLLV